HAREHAARLDVIALLHVDGDQCAGELGVDADQAQRLDGPRNGDLARNGTARDRLDLDRDNALTAGPAHAGASRLSGAARLLAAATRRQRDQGEYGPACLPST